MRRLRIIRVLSGSTHAESPSSWSCYLPQGLVARARCSDDARVRVWLEWENGQTAVQGLREGLQPGCAAMSKRLPKEAGKRKRSVAEGIGHP